MWRQHNVLVIPYKRSIEIDGTNQIDQMNKRGGRELSLSLGGHGLNHLSGQLLRNIL